MVYYAVSAVFQSYTCNKGLLTTMVLYVAPFQCAPRVRTDQTVSTGVPVRMEPSVTTSQGSVSVGLAGRGWAATKVSS